MAISQKIIPTLEIVSGSQAGRQFRLDPTLTIIGRNSDCNIILEPMSVSRKHASIEHRNSRYLLRDMGSTRGTYLNQKKVTCEPVPIEEGATIQIADLLMTFHSQVLQVQEEADETQSTIFASIEVLPTKPSSMPIVKPAEKFRAFQKISQQLSSRLELQEILEQTLDTLFEIFPNAERGFILLKEGEPGSLVPQVLRSRTGPTGELTISRTVLDRVLNKGEAILSKNVIDDFPDCDSVSGSLIHSLMCSPLWDGNRRPIGVIQIDTRDGQAQFNQDDLDLLATVAGQIAAAVQAAHLHKALLHQREMEQELQIARQVLQALLPERPTQIRGYEFWEYYEPARHIGGDYYGYIPLADPNETEESPPSRWAIAVGDVVGKGLPAALLTSKLSSEIRLFLQLEADPAAVVTRLNRHLDPGGNLDMFITFLLIVLDIRTHELTLVNAGHPPPLVRRGDGTLEEFGLGNSSLPLSVLRDSEYHTVMTTLGEEDIVILYSDGVTDALNAAQERFSEGGRLHRTVMAAPKYPAQVGEYIMQAVRGHVGAQPQFDDITLICLGRTKGGGSSPKA